jgi:AbrB family looped-hinge helix DNA binding protein
MPVSTVSSKGQITLPAQVRRKLRIKPNDRVTIDAVDDAIVIKRAPDLFELKGFLGKAIPERQERERMRRAVAAHLKGGRP